MTTYAYEQLGMRRVTLRVDPDNIASVGVARATGFELTGDDRSTRNSSRPLLTWHHRSMAES